MKKSKLGLLFLSSLALVTGVASTGVAGILANQSNISVVNAATVSATAVYDCSASIGTSNRSLDDYIYIKQSALNNYSGPVRIYKGDTVTFAVISGKEAKITAIRISVDTSYSGSLNNTLGATWNGATATGSNGVVTATATSATGATTITVKTSSQVRWNKIEIDYTYEKAVVNVESVELDMEDCSLRVGETKQLVATVFPTNASNQAVSWSSSNEDVATVSSLGVVTALSIGTSAITVTTEDGSKTDVCNITVQAAVTEEQIQNMQANLNNVQSWFGLGYSYTYSKEKGEVLKTDSLDGKNTCQLSSEYKDSAATTYVEWSGSSTNYSSGAEYAGFSNGQSGQSDTLMKDVIGLRGYKSVNSKATYAGIVSTKSGGTAKSITFTWNKNTTKTSTRKVRIHASHDPFTSVKDLYNNNNYVSDTTKIVDLEYDGSKESYAEKYTFTDEYEYIGITSSNNEAIYFDNIDIEWNSAEKTKSDFRLRLGVSKPAETLSNDFSYEFGMKVSQGTKEKYYSLAEDGSVASELDSTGTTPILYKIIGLGDVLNNIERASDVFTVQAYVKYNEQLYYPSATPKSYSLKSLIAEYYSGEHGEDVKESVSRMYSIMEELGVQF